jgi:hypothetical protein
MGGAALTISISRGVITIVYATNKNPCIVPEQIQQLVKAVFGEEQRIFLSTIIK